MGGILPREQGAAGPDLLLESKITPPRSRAAAIDRSVLERRLDAAVTESRLVLVVAPAGWGKSTTLATWASSPARRLALDSPTFGWYTVEDTDNDPVVFWSYLAASLRALPGADVASLLDALHQLPGELDAVAPRLLNLLAAMDDRVVIVVEDLHLIYNESILETFSFFVQHLPTTVSVVVSSRGIPQQLPLGRLRARGELTQLTVAELALDRDATAELLRATALEVEDAIVERVQTLTEGWPAGVHLAALTLRENGMLPDDFAGDNTFVGDFLMAEVFELQSLSLRNFLVRSSALPKMSAELCDSVLGIRDSAEMLRELERSQLFITAIDGSRRWFRYHPLFAEFLQHRLVELGTDPGGLHRRAAEWFAHQGEFDAAIEHAFDSTDLVFAARLIYDHYVPYLQGGRIDTVVGWFDRIPRELFAADASLNICRALVLAAAGRMPDVEMALATAERAPRPIGRVANFANIDSAVSIVRATNLYYLGDIAEARLWNERGLRYAEESREPGGHSPTYVLGMCAYQIGDYAAAGTWLERDTVWADESSSGLLGLLSVGYLAVVHARNGNVVAAQRCAARSRELAAGYGSSRTPRGLPELALGRLALLSGDFETAHRELRASLDAAYLSPDRLTRVEILLALADAERALGMSSEALRHAARARDQFDACRDPGPLLTAEIHGRSGTGSRRPAGLTDRQLEVLRLVANGARNAEVAVQLGLSERTVHAHLRTIYDRLGVTSRTAAARFAFDHNLA